MRRILFLISFFLIAILSSTGQTIVTTSGQYRNVVLEEYTGIHCGYCPEGHEIAEQLSVDNPDRVVIINIHAGIYATPGAGEPDFRTEFGDTLADHAGVTGYPAGTINRHVFPNLSTSSNTSLSRGAWTAAAAEIFPEVSPVNVGFNSDFNSSTRELTIEVEAYYVFDSPQTSNYLQIALLENHVFGYQSSGGSNYDHKHILRHLITGMWGETISSTTAGSLYSNTFTYTVPSDWDIANCDIAVYVSETKDEIYTGVLGIADGGSHNGETALFQGNIISDEAIVAGNVGSVSTILLEATSFVEGTNDFEISFALDAPEGWTAELEIAGTSYSSTTTINLNNSATEDIYVKITPSENAGIGTVSISMSATNYPGEPAAVGEASVISGVKDLIIHNRGEFGTVEGGPSVFDSIFTQCFEYAESDCFASASIDFLEKATIYDALEGVLNIYFNAAWVFPVLPDATVETLIAFLNNGGNLYISGQDLAWATWASDDYNTPVAQGFMTEYLNASYVDDGSTANNSIYADTSDLIFGELPYSTLKNIYGTGSQGGAMMYPDVINPIDSGVSFLYYNNDITKSCGIRAVDNGSKIVYLGFDLPMIEDDSTRLKFMKLTYDWFHEGDTLGNTSVESIAEFETNIYPNPAKENVFVSIKSDKYSEKIASIYNSQGSLIELRKLPKSNFSTIKFDTNNLSSGIYFIKTSSKDSTKSFKIIIE